jgi:hypothetical protein
MTSLQKVNLGTAPTGTDGDPVRTGFTKINSNVDVFNSQAALTSATGITAAQALTVAHIGKRINIALATAGVVNLPAAATCGADNVLILRNIGTTVVTLAITAGSGDTIALSKLNPGETALMDTDGIHAWTVLMRGRTNADNEIVNGNCTVNGNETVGGTLGVSGNTTVGGTLAVTGGLVAGTALVTSPSTADSSTKVASTATVDAKVTARAVGRTVLASLVAATSAGVATGLTGYKSYEIHFDGLVPASDGASMMIEFSFDNGATWLTTANYRYALTFQSSSAPTLTGSGATGQNTIVAWTGMKAAAGSVYAGRMELSGMNSGARFPQLDGKVLGTDSGNGAGVVRIYAQAVANLSAGANAVRIRPSSGNWAAGTFTVYGNDG